MEGQRARVLRFFIMLPLSDFSVCPMRATEAQPFFLPEHLVLAPTGHPV